MRGGLAVFQCILDFFTFSNIPDDSIAPTNLYHIAMTITLTPTTVTRIKALRLFYPFKRDVAARGFYFLKDLMGLSLSVYHHRALSRLISR